MSEAYQLDERTMRKFVREFGTSTLFEIASSWFKGTTPDSTFPSRWTQEEISKKMARCNIGVNGHAVSTKLIQPGGSKEYGYFEFRSDGEKKGKHTYKVSMYGDLSLDNAKPMDFTIYSVSDK